MERTLQQFSTKDLLKELHLRVDVAVASWSLEDIEDEIAHRADHRGLELFDSAPVTERAAEIIARLHHRLESIMVESTFEVISDEAEQVVDQFIETGHAKEQE